MDNGMEKMVLAAFKGAIEQGFSIIEETDFLTDGEKDILLRYYRDGESGAEIGKVYGVTHQAIHFCKKKALGRVRNVIYCKCAPKGLIKQKGLSSRSRNALLRSGFEAPDKILAYIASQDVDPVEALMEIKNVGKKSAKEIYAFLKDGKNWKVS